MEKTQTATHILMIRPINFAFNTETAINNTFQVDDGSDSNKTQENALAEFDEFVKILKNHKINVIVVNDTKVPYTPDSIYPNNIFSYHHNGNICIYPVFAKNRREERKPSILEEIEKYFKIIKTINLTNYEDENKFLEGTGSLVLDHENKNVFACLSPRTNVEVIDAFCQFMDYSGTKVIFNANDQNGQQIYHTNVMMSIADKYAIICLECIHSKDEQNHLLNTLKKVGKEIIEISRHQMKNFAGNVLQIMNKDGEKFLVMSTRAYESLNQGQIKTIEFYNKIIRVNLNVIENNGGGSARCMLCEIFLPLQ